MGRSAIVTGASSGIGFAISEVLAQTGHDLTVVARRPDGLPSAAASLRGYGTRVDELVADIAAPETPSRVAAAHRAAFGRCDVLVNNAGVGIGAPLASIEDRQLDLQLNVNLRAVVLLYREALDLLLAAAADHRSAIVINIASLGGKRPGRLVSVYSATKAAVIAFTGSMNQELNHEGIKSTALCPGFVSTPFTDWVTGTIPKEDMIPITDIAGAVRWLLTTSPQCIVPELVMSRPGDVI